MTVKELKKKNNMGYNMKNSPINQGYAAKPSPAKAITLAAIGAAIGKFAATAAGKAAISGAAGAVVNQAANALGKGDIGKQNDVFGGVKMGTDSNPVTQKLSQMPYHSQQRYQEYERRNWAQDHTTSGYSQKLGTSSPSQGDPIQADILSSSDDGDEPTSTNNVEPTNNNTNDEVKTSKPLWKKGEKFLDQGVTELAVKIGINKLFQPKKEYKPGDYTSNFSKMQLGTEKEKKA